MYLDGTFCQPSRTHSKIAISSIPTTMAGMVDHIMRTLLSQESPISPKILLSAGHHDISPQNLPTTDPEYLAKNNKAMIMTISRHILNPLTHLYHNVARRGGTLWTTSLCPRPINFRVNPSVSNVLSEAFLYANAYISHLNHKQNLTNMPIHQVLQYPSLHPALKTMQRTVNLKMYRGDATRLTSLAQERIWRRIAQVLRRTWGPRRSSPPSTKMATKPRMTPYPPPEPRRRIHRTACRERRRHAKRARATK